MTDVRTPAPAQAQAQGRHRTIGELVVDIVLVVGISAYLLVAQNYPPDGRQIPTVVGVIGLIAALVQLVGWFVRPLWSFTHGNPPSRTGLPGGIPDADAQPVQDAGAVPADAATGAAPAVDTAAAPDHSARDTVVIMAWAGGFLVAILALGYEWGVPLFFLGYFLSRRSWKLAIGSAVVMWALTKFVFIGLLAIALPTGALL